MPKFLTGGTGGVSVLRSRRFSALIYARSEIHVRSAVPDELRPAHQPPHPDDAKRRGRRGVGGMKETGLKKEGSGPCGRSMEEHQTLVVRDHQCGSKSTYELAGRDVVYVYMSIYQRLCYF